MVSNKNSEVVTGIKGGNENNGKSIIHLPRQNLYFCLKRLKIKAFEE